MDLFQENLHTESTQTTFESIEELADFVRPLMSAIAAAIGPHCEVVLHDLSKREMGRTIYAIENGHVSGRDIGGPSTNLGIEALKDESANHNIFGYAGRTRGGRDLSCSSVYFRNSEGSIIGAFCINLDLTPLQSAGALLTSMFPRRSEGESVREVVGEDIESVLDDMISEALGSVDAPVALMQRPDRIKVVRLLEQRGVFQIKRSVERVSEMLGVSRVTCYSYLDHVRREADQEGGPTSDTKSYLPYFER